MLRPAAMLLASIALPASAAVAIPTVEVTLPSRLPLPTSYSAQIDWAIYGVCPVTLSVDKSPSSRFIKKHYVDTQFNSPETKAGFGQAMQALTESEEIMVGASVTSCAISSASETPDSRASFKKEWERLGMQLFPDFNPESIYKQGYVGNWSAANITLDGKPLMGITMVYSKADGERPERLAIEVGPPKSESIESN